MNPRADSLARVVLFVETADQVAAVREVSHGHHVSNDDSTSVFGLRQGAGQEHELLRNTVGADLKGRRIERYLALLGGRHPSRDPNLRRERLADWLFEIVATLGANRGRGAIVGERYEAAKRTAAPAVVVRIRDVNLSIRSSHHSAESGLLGARDDDGLSLLASCRRRNRGCRCWGRGGALRVGAGADRGSTQHTLSGLSPVAVPFSTGAEKANTKP